MKAKLSPDEWYPVWLIIPEGSEGFDAGWAPDQVHDVPDDLAKRHEAACVELQKTNDEVEAIVEEYRRRS